MYMQLIVQYYINNYVIISISDYDQVNNNAPVVNSNGTSGSSSNPNVSSLDCLSHIVDSISPTAATTGGAVTTQDALIGANTMPQS